MWNDADEARRIAEARVDSGEAGETDRELARPTIRQLLDDPRHRRQVGVLLIGALATTTGWWAVSTLIPQFTGQQLAGKVTDIPGNITLVVLCYNAAGVVGYLTMGILADRIGRKPTVFLYFAASLVMTPILFELADTKTALLILAALNGFFTLGQWTWLALYTSEVFPTNIRATAMTVVFNMARFAAAAGTLLVATLIDAFGSIGSAAIVIGCIAYGVGALVAPFIGPETRARPLPGTPSVAPRPAPEPVTVGAP
jgi:MFS family permease